MSLELEHQVFGVFFGVWVGFMLTGEGFNLAFAVLVTVYTIVLVVFLRGTFSAETPLRTRLKPLGLTLLLPVVFAPVLLSFAWRVGLQSSVTGEEVMFLAVIVIAWIATTEISKRDEYERVLAAEWRRR